MNGKNLKVTIERMEIVYHSEASRKRVGEQNQNQLHSIYEVTLKTSAPRKVERKAREKHIPGKFQAQNSQRSYIILRNARLYDESLRIGRIL